MADIADFIIGGIKGASDLFRTGYGVYQDQRNYKYQNDLQDKIFAREDSAIQRRVADAQEAGINPYDAIGAGSGAGATSAGGVSSTPIPDLNVGSWLDFSLAKQALLQQKEKTKQEKDLSSIINFQKAMASRQDFQDKMRFKYETGADQFYSHFNNDYNFSWNYNKADFKNDDEYFDSSPFMQRLKLGLQNFINESDMLQTDRNWYSANMLLNALNSGTGSIGNVVGAFHGGFGSYRDYQGGKYFKAQRNYFEPEFTYPKHEMGFHP